MGFKDMDTETDDNFLRVEAGKFVQFNILSTEPQKFLTHWINRKPTPCQGSGCTLCTEGNKPRKSWRIAVFDRASNAVKEFEFGAMIAGQIKNIDSVLAESQQTIQDVDIRINRQGAGLEDTEYFVLSVPKKPFPDDVIPF